MFLSFILLILSLLIVIKSADFAIRYSTGLAGGFGLSKYIVGFMIVAIISILPETFISITSTLEGSPSFGLGTLFGSNIADLTLIFALIIFISGRSVKVESKIIKDQFLYIIVMLIPIILGINGYYSRLEGIILICTGLIFYYLVLRKNASKSTTARKKIKFLDLIFLLISMAVLLIASHLTVRYGVRFATSLHVSPVLVGMFVVGLGTTLPELLFAIKASRKKHDDLALGDILGTVIADATIVVGILAVINPFGFNQRIIYVSGIFMISSVVLLFHFMKTGKILTRKEGFLLLIYYLLFVVAELIANRFF